MTCLYGTAQATGLMNPPHLHGNGLCAEGPWTGLGFALGHCMGIRWGSEFAWFAGFVCLWECASANGRSASHSIGPFGQWQDWALGNRPPLSQEGRCGSSCRKSRAHPSNFRQKLCNLVLCSVVCECALWSKLRSALSDGFAIQGHCPGFMAQ